MHISNAMPGMILADDIFDESGMLLLEKGICLTTRYLKRLQRLHISVLRIHDPIAEKLKKDRAISAELHGEIQLCFQSLYRLQTSRIMNAKLSKLYLKQLEHLVRLSIDETSRRTAAKHTLHNLQLRQPDDDAATHGINVCLLSLAAGLRLGLSRTSLEELCLGALLHDIGKSLQQTGSPAIAADLHSLYGRNLLTLLDRTSIACRIAAEHHERPDGFGQPLGLCRDQLHPLSQLVSIANHFDNALRQSLLDGTPRQEIVEAMMAHGNTAFDLKLLTAFLHAVPLYAVGSLVRLNSGETAYVTANHPQFPLRPRLHLTEQCGGNFIDLLQTSTLTIQEVIEE